MGLDRKAIEVLGQDCLRKSLDWYIPSTELTPRRFTAGDKIYLSYNLPNNSGGVAAWTLNGSLSFVREVAPYQGGNVLACAMPGGGCAVAYSIKQQNNSSRGARIEFLDSSGSLIWTTDFDPDNSNVDASPSDLCVSADGNVFFRFGENVRGLALFQPFLGQATVPGIRILTGHSSGFVTASGSTVKLFSSIATQQWSKSLSFTNTVTITTGASGRIAVGGGTGGFDNKCAFALLDTAGNTLIQKVLTIGSSVSGLRPTLDGGVTVRCTGSAELVQHYGPTGVLQFSIPLPSTGTWAGGLDDSILLFVPALVSKFASYDAAGQLVVERETALDVSMSDTVYAAMAGSSGISYTYVQSIKPGFQGPTSTYAMARSEDGRELWRTVLSQGGSENAAVVVAKDQSQFYCSGGTNFQLAKLDREGQVLWSTSSNVGVNLFLVGVVPRSDGGAIVVRGQSPSFGSVAKTWVTIFNGAGQEVSSFELDPGRECSMWSVCAAGDGGFILAGSGRFTGTLRSTVVKCTSSGATQWTYTDEGSFSGYLSCMSDGQGGCFASQQYDGGSVAKVEIDRVGPTGQLLWRCKKSDWVTTAAGEIEFATDHKGGTFVFHNPNRTVAGSQFAARIDQNGNVLWSRDVGLPVARPVTVSSVTPAGTGGAAVAYVDLMGSSTKSFVKLLAEDGSDRWPSNGSVFANGFVQSGPDDSGYFALTSNGLGDVLIFGDRWSLTTDNDAFLRAVGWDHEAASAVHVVRGRLRSGTVSDLGRVDGSEVAFDLDAGKYPQHDALNVEFSGTVTAQQGTWLHCAASVREDFEKGVVVFEVFDRVQGSFVPGNSRDASKAGSDMSLTVPYGPTFVGPDGAVKCRLRWTGTGPIPVGPSSGPKGMSVDRVAWVVE
ncbi:MAG: hypothetical protein JST30_08430 [Armatimonadetes bacterium]|nr:hypothetical protein [Armatimonadota bacterium]